MRSAPSSKSLSFGALIFIFAFTEMDAASAQDERRRLALQPQVMQSTSAGLWGLPFKGEDFREDERVYWGREIHSESGVQKYGYDLR